MRLILAAIIGLWGGAVGLATFGFDRELLAAVTVAAGIAGLITSPLFLIDDDASVGWSILGALTSTALGSGFVGIWMAADRGLIESATTFFMMPIMLTAMLLDSIPGLLVWILGAAMIHALGRYSLK